MDLNFWLNQPSPPDVRIEGGEEVVPHSIPWQVAIIVRRFPPPRRYVCGGTLISPIHVLTAAHCVRRLPCSAYAVEVGKHREDVKDGIEFGISHIEIHPKFAILPVCVVSFDVAIIHLTSPVDINDKVSPACLPDKKRMGGDFLAGKTLTVSGWGRGSNSVLHKARYPGITHEKCRALMDKFTRKGCITRDVLCAGNYESLNASHSSGDSGGKLSKVPLRDKVIRAKI